MKPFKIIISNKAETDIQDVTNHIQDKYGASMTAKRYKVGLDTTIQRLPVLAGVSGFNPFVQSMFGKNARHIVYKKMAIIYVIRGNIVYIKRVIASSMIH
jgi:plasmid stabilization system protein ParE